MKRMERLAGAVERFVCGSGGRVEVSKCRAVLGPAFAGARSKPGGRSDDGVRLCGAASVGLGRWAGCANGAERFDAGGYSIKQLIFPLDIVKKSLIL